MPLNEHQEGSAEIFGTYSYGAGLTRKQILLDLERRGVGAEPQLSLL